MMIQMRDHAERPDGSPEAGSPLTCEEFQDQMSTLMSGYIREHEHLRTCLRCNALLDELEYISEIAKGLLPSYDPSDKVWKGIADSLQKPSEPEGESNGFHSKQKG
jgi:hypothetical protein